MSGKLCIRRFVKLSKFSVCIKILKTFPWTYALPLNSVLFWIAFCYSLHIHECSVCVLQVLHSGIPGTEILCYIVEKRQSSIFIHRPHNSISLSGHDIVNFVTHLANIWPVLLIPSKAFLCNSFFTSFIDISNYLQHLFFPIFVWYTSCLLPRVCKYVWCNTTETQALCKSTNSHN